MFRSWLWLFCALWMATPVFAAPSDGSAPVDLNLASAEELQKIPGVGPSTAAAIVRYRLSRGPFRQVNHLERVSGIGPSSLEKMRPYVVVGDWKAAREVIEQERAQDQGPQGPVVDINLATVDELGQLPGIGPSKAQAIFEERERRGPFKRCRQLERVTGIGPSTVDQLLDFCTATVPER